MLRVICFFILAPGMKFIITYQYLPYSIMDEDNLFGSAALPFYQENPKTIQSTQYCKCGGPSRGACHPFRLIRDPASPVSIDPTGTVNIQHYYSQ